MLMLSIAENETAFELYKKLTGGALDANSTLQDKATAEQKYAYILAHKILTETKKADKIEIKGADNDGSSDTGILEREGVLTSDRRNDILWKQNSNTKKMAQIMEKNEENAIFLAGDDGWLSLATETGSIHEGGLTFDILRSFSKTELKSEDSIGRTLSAALQKKFSDNGNLVRIKKRSIQASESTSPINADYGMNTSNNRVPQSDTVVNSNSMQDAEDNTQFSFKNSSASLTNQEVKKIQLDLPEAPMYLTIMMKIPK